MNILITNIGANTALTAVKLFKGKEVRIIGTDILKPYELAGSKFCDNYYIVPRFTNPNYLKKIVEICKIEKIDAIIPIIDGEIEVLTKSKNFFGKIKLISSPYKTIKICNDKWKAYKFFSTNSIPTPKTCLMNVSKNIGEKVIYKPRRGIGSKGIIDNGLLYDKAPEGYIAQQKIIGQEYTIDCFCDKNGDLIYAVPRKRIEIRHGICSKGETVNNDVFLESINKIVDKMKFYGPINIQVFLTNNQNQYYTEINPRLGASTIITREAGIDIADCILSLINDIDIKPIEKYKFVRMNRFLSEVFFDNYLS